MRWPSIIWRDRYKQPCHRNLNYRWATWRPLRINLPDWFRLWVVNSTKALWIISRIVFNPWQIWSIILRMAHYHLVRYLFSSVFLLPRNQPLLTKYIMYIWLFLFDFSDFSDVDVFKAMDLNKLLENTFGKSPSEFSNLEDLPGLHNRLLSKPVTAKTSNCSVHEIIICQLDSIVANISVP